MNLLIAFLNLRRIDVFLFIGIKAKLHKIYVKEFFFAKGVATRPGSKENVFFFRIFKQKAFFAKKTILKIKVTVFRAQKTFFPF